MRLWREADGEVRPSCLDMDCPNSSAASMTTPTRRSYQFHAHDYCFDFICFNLLFTCCFSRENL